MHKSSKIIRKSHKDDSGSDFHHNQTATYISVMLSQLEWIFRQQNDSMEIVIFDMMTLTLRNKRQSSFSRLKET